MSSVIARDACRYLLLAGLTGILLSGSAYAQGNSGRESALGRLLDTLDVPGAQGSARVSKTSDGYLRFLGAPPARQFKVRPGSPNAPEDRAAAWVAEWRGLLATDSAPLNYKPSRVRNSGAFSVVSFDQTYDGIPVYAGRVAVQVNDRGGIDCVISDVLMDTVELDSGVVLTLPALVPSEAQDAAVAWMVKARGEHFYAATGPELKIYDPQVVGESGPVRLVYAFTVGATDEYPVRESILVDADSGEIAFHFSLIHEAENRRIYDSNNTPASPGTLARIEGGPPSPIADVNFAYDYFGDTYEFYFNEHGRDSIDDAGYILSATVRYCEPGYPCPYQNAFWDGTRMYFGQGFAAADDVVSHELTHGVTSNESDLIYANQSGAINEAFSDMWGEWVDQVNGAGTDTPAVKWLIGEDIPGGGAFRNMANPPAFNDPDRMGSPLYYTGSGDNGGVHTNSGVANKLCFLLTDGGSFNGQTISGMGISSAAALFYECQINLLGPGSDYGDLYNALGQAAVNLGLPQTDRNNIETACVAVEIKPLPDPATNFAAMSSPGNPNVNLNWNNPAQGGLQAIVIRRDTVGFPATPTSGTGVFNGLGTSTINGPLTIGVRYYYSAWAFYGDSAYSAATHAQAVAGDVQSNFFTELFLTDNDLDFKTLTFTPSASANFYDACVESASAYPTDPSGGLSIALSDDSAVLLTLGSGATVSLYGAATSSFYINSNGNITLGAADFNYLESLGVHFGLPRIAALFDDLNPGAGGQVSVKQLADRAAVTFNNVPQYGAGDANSFQIEWFFNGVIRVTFLGIAATDGIAGLSQGLGQPAGFVESDLSAFGGCGVVVPELELVSPNGGESYFTGSTQSILWTSTGPVGSNVAITLHAGASNVTLVASTPNDGAFDWVVPNVPDSSSCFVVVESATNPSINDQNDAPFSVETPPSIAVTRPDGGETFYRGTVESLQWSSAGQIGANVKISLRQGVQNWDIAPSTPNDGAFDWTIPVDFPNGLGYFIAIASVDNPTVSDESNAAFAIAGPSVTVTRPNGGEVFYKGTTEPILWASSGPVGANVKITLRLGAQSLVVAASTPNDGAFNWLVPSSVPNASTYFVTIESVTNASIADQGDGLFTIAVLPTLTVTRPNGGETFNKGSVQSITWASTGTIAAVNILLRQGASQIVLASATANDGLFDWTVPANLANGNDYFVAVESTANPAINDQGNAAFTITDQAPATSITVTRPNGGETFAKGSVQPITWTSTGSIASVKIVLRLGTSQLVLASSTPNDGAFDWTVPSNIPNSSGYIVTIESTANSAVIDQSNAAFTVTDAAPPAGTITVTRPNGGEVFVKGTIEQVTWTSSGVVGTDVKITLRLGASSRVIVASTPNDGSFDWTVFTDVPINSGYSLEVSSVSSAAITDTSTGLFRIQ